MNYLPSLSRRRLCALALLIFATSHSPGSDAQPRPNILFILTDDQGATTLGSYGGKRVATPHLDSLARDGVRFTDAYVMPQCTPTRAALLSGQHTARTGMWHVISWYGLPWARVAEPMFREQLPPELSVLPRSLRAAGYATGMAGKWHLTSNATGNYVALEPEAGPDYGFGFVANPEPGSPNTGDKWVDHLTDEAIAFIERERERPWFFYLAHHTLHGKVSAPAELVEKYRAKGAPEQGMHNATYLAAIEHLDSSVGRLLAKLDELKLREQTMVVFLSDNGGVKEVYALPKAPFDAKTTLEVVSAEFDNAPLRAGKGSPYEGGIRVPCLVRWPGAVKAGTVSDTPIHAIDWLPTLLEATGAKSAAIQGGDGMSLVPLMKGKALPARPLFWYLPLYDLRWGATPCAVIRDGDWKLIEFFGDRFDAGGTYHAGHHYELFNLRSDLGESRNLADVEPRRVERLGLLLHDWMKAIPVPIPDANPHFLAERIFEETKVKQPWNHDFPSAR